MTGLLTGTNKFKNFEIETSLKISVLNSPYLEGRRYVYGNESDDSVTPPPPHPPHPGLKIITKDNMFMLTSGNYLIVIEGHAGSIYNLVIDNNIVTAARLQQDSETVWGADVDVTYSDESGAIPPEYQVGTIRPLSQTEVYTTITDVKRNIERGNSGLTVNESSPIIMENTPQINGILMADRI